MSREMRIPLSPSLASARFKEVWGDGYLLGDIATTLMCTEFEALADMLLAVGVDPQTVEDFEGYHAAGDDCGDLHCRCDDADCIAEREA